jgi:AcrR family transcriptional regulator
MKSGQSPRPYKMVRRAEAAERTRLRIIEAGIGLFMARYYSDVTLEQVAAEAQVTLQTVLRRFGSKEGLFDAVLHHGSVGVTDPRNAVAPGDVDGAVDSVVSTFEIFGDSTMRSRHQADQVEVLGQVTKMGHKWHRAWTARIFGPLVATDDSRERRRRLAALAAATDTYTWRLLRRDYGLSMAETRRAMCLQVRALIATFAEA